MRKFAHGRRTSSRPATIECLEQRRLLSATLRGTLYQDTNSDAKLTYPEPALAGWRVYVDSNNNGQYDSGEIQVLTDGAGSYSLTGVPAGTVTWRVELASHNGWWPTTPVDSVGTYTHAVLDGDLLVGYNFGVSPPPQYTPPPNQTGTELDCPLELGGFTDGAADGPWSVHVQWGDSTQSDIFNLNACGGIGNRAHAYPDDGSYNVIVTVIDAHGGAAHDQFSVTIDNSAPWDGVLKNTGPVSEATPVTIYFSEVSDAPGDMSSLKYSFDFGGDGVWDVTDSSSPSQTFTYTDNATITVRGRIRDKDGGETILTTNVQVTNVPPTITVSGAPTAFVGQSYRLNTTYTDPGSDSVTTWHIDWGDGVVQNINFRPFTSHTYASEGDYDIRVSGIDDDGTYSVAPVHVTVAMPPTILTGRLYNDVSGDGKLNSGEAGIANRTVFLDSNKNGLREAGETSTTTSANGSFTFNGLASGTYRVRVALPKGWRFSNVPVGYKDVAVAAGKTTSAGAILATTRPLVSGYVFWDLNRSGIKDVSERSLSSWRVYVDANKNGVWDKTEVSVLSDAYGNYSIGTLAPGSYVLRLWPNKGFGVTAPKTRAYTLKLGAGQVVANRNFGASKGA